MNKIDSVSTAWCDSLLNDAIAAYDRALTHGDTTRMMPQFAAANAVFRSLDRESQLALLGLLKVVSVDAASQILGTIDGSSLIAGIDGEFSISYEGGNVGAGLQDSFLSTVEDGGYLPRK